jgi:GT2 family glycosyltransferase
MLAKRGVFEKVGLFSEDYFMYAEDIDLNYKVKRAGLTNFYIGQARIVHHGGTSSSKHSASQWSTVMKFRAMMKFYQKTRGQLYAFLYRTAMGCSALGRLGLLGFFFVFGGGVWNRTQLQGASTKWSTILKCALGLAG